MKVLMVGFFLLCRECGQALKPLRDMRRGEVKQEMECGTNKCVMSGKVFEMVLPEVELKEVEGVTAKDREDEEFRKMMEMA